PWRRDGATRCDIRPPRLFGIRATARWPCANDRTRGGAPARIQPCRTLAAVDAFTVYAVLRSEHPVDDAAVEVVSRGLQRHGERLRIWRDEQDPTAVRVSTDVDAAGVESALDAGHALAQQARALCPLPASVEEVVAMTDEDQLVWRAEPERVAAGPGPGAGRRPRGGRGRRPSERAAALTEQHHAEGCAVRAQRGPEPRQHLLLAGQRQA